MRDEEELENIALEWANNTISEWQKVYHSWDVINDDYDLTEDELEFCQSLTFNIEVSKEK